MGIEVQNELLLAVRLLVSEDRCEGRFVFGRQIPAPSKKSAKVALPEMVSKGGMVSKSGVDNPKTDLQTVLARAGHGAPAYKTKQLKNNQFRSTVIFNGLNFVGQPCGNKKLAEKDAAAEALLWLRGDRHSSARDLDHASMLLKRKNRSKKRT